jgi:transcriptional regulator with XRE-family HTH domain
MSESSPEQLGRLIYQQRHARGMSQEDLAKGTGIHLSTISRFEQGAIDSPDPLKLQRVATALGTDVEDYFALVGYFMPHGLPDLAPYLRAKFGAGPEVAREVESYFAWLRERQDQGGEDKAA